MALPWARLDANIGSHDKILGLLSDPAPKAIRWQAFSSYMTAIAWSVGHGTDGKIPAATLPFVHGTNATARLLVTYRLWVETTSGWEIRNFAQYQATDELATKTREGQRQGGAKGACARWHEPNCECWKAVGAQ